MVATKGAKEIVKRGETLNGQGSLLMELTMVSLSCF